MRKFLLTPFILLFALSTFGIAIICRLTKGKPFDQIMYKMLRNVAPKNDLIEFDECMQIPSFAERPPETCPDPDCKYVIRARIRFFIDDPNANPIRMAVAGVDIRTNHLLESMREANLPDLELYDQIYNELTERLRNDGLLKGSQEMRVLELRLIHCEVEE